MTSIDYAVIGGIVCLAAMLGPVVFIIVIAVMS